MNDTLICLASEKLYAEEDTRRVIIQADSVPATMPTTGAGVEGLPDSARIAPGSIIYIPTPYKVFFMLSTGEWAEKA